MKSLLKKYGASPLPQVMVRQASKQRQVTLEELTIFCKFLFRAPQLVELSDRLIVWFVCVRLRLRSQTKSTTRPRRPGRRRSCATTGRASWWGAW